MKDRKKLFWVEYTDAGGFDGIVRSFEALDFAVKVNGWFVNHPEELWEHVFPEVRSWQPDIIVFWLRPGQRMTGEPPEWRTAVQQMRADPDLQHTKIMAFLGFGQPTAAQSRIWRQRYDFHSMLPFRMVEHVKIAKRLVGEEIKSWEGVNYLLKRNGSWRIQDYLLEEAFREENRPDAKGEFAWQPQTRLLGGARREGVTWVAGGIQAEVPTSIVYLIKKSSSPWEMGLGTSDISRLSTLANACETERQLLVGANEDLLHADPAAVNQVLDQAQQAGGWRVFINEHLWYEGLPASKMEWLYGEAPLQERQIIVR